MCVSPPAQPSPVTKSVMISSLGLGDEVADCFILSMAQQGQARNGPYWRLEFRDASGSIGGKIWSPQSQAYPELAAGMPVWLKARVTSYRDKLELAIESMRLLDDSEFAVLDLALFMPASPVAPERMMQDILELCRKELTHKPWRKLIISLLSDEEIAARLRLAPAAKAMHHAYAGGLLEHTLSVARLCLRIADGYPQLDRQTLLAGAVCHDLGKLWELESGLVMDYTQQGRLIGHIVLVLEKIAPFMQKVGLEPALADHLRHLILSHHGTYEFGSPRLPSTAEAMVLHYADNIDAKLHQLGSALAGVEENGWSPYIPALERSLFRAEPTPVSAQAGRSENRKAETAASGSKKEPPAPEAASSHNDANAAEQKRRQPLPLFSQCSLLSKE